MAVGLRSRAYVDDQILSSVEGQSPKSVPVQSLTKAFALAVSSSFLVLNIGGSQGLPG